MSVETLHIGVQAVIDRKHFPKLLEALKKEYCQLLGPTIAEGALVYAEIQSAAELPIGRIDLQEAGRYRLADSELPTLFGYVVGQHSWKQFLHPAEERLWEAEADGKSFKMLSDPLQAQPRALIGVRPCELAAIAIHDKALGGGPYRDPKYEARRRETFILAVNCTRPGGTCFCSSMGTGPQATSGFDLALTEVCNAQEHYFVVEIGSERGAAVAAGLSLKPASAAQIQAAQKLLAESAGNMGRALEAEGLPELLDGQFDSLHWEEIAKRCLSCANCTMVCPTCFCSNVEDHTDLTGKQVERRRRWDSCYSVDFSYIHGGSIRTSAAARYRQWLTHKLSYWVEQFGTFGCVGCGRCITWCPAAIDLTEEVKVFRAVARESETV